MSLLRVGAGFAVVACFVQGQGTGEESDPTCDTAACVAPDAADSAFQRDHVMLAVSHRVSAGKTDSEGSASGAAKVEDAACTGRNGDPYARSSPRECCGGLEKRLGEWSHGHWSYRCLPAEVEQNAATGACTPEDDDPWRTGSFVECCGGFEAELGPWRGEKRSYRCRSSWGTPTPSPQVHGGHGDRASFKVLEWNVYYKNKDTMRIAQTINERQPVADIIGLCEFTGSMGGMASALSSVSGRRFEAQPGRNGWKGYGTDIFYDSGKWKALEGGVVTSGCKSKGGQRAANWAVLKDRSSGSVLITGGTHLSFCREGCDWLHECELDALYRRLDDMKGKYSEAAVVWMGDLNLNVHSGVVKNLFNGRVGSRKTFEVRDVAKTDRNTHMNGGKAIDHIFGERHAVHLKHGQHGSTGQGDTGRRLSGADHFPIYSVLHIGR